MKNLRILIGLSAMLILVAVLGCAPAATQAPAAPAAPAATEAQAAPPADEPPAKVTLCYSPPTLEMTDFYKFGQQGLELKAEEIGLNVEVITKAPSSHSAAEEQLRIVEDFITQGCNYLWVVPVSTEAGPPMFDAAKKAGIPIFVGHALYDDPKSLGIINVGTNFQNTGKSVGEWISTNLNCEGPVGIIRGAAGEYDAWRVESAITAMKEKCPDMMVYASDYTDWLTENALKQTKTLLQAHPDIKMLYNPASPLTLGAVQAIEEMGLTKQVQVLDYDFIPAVQKMCPEGKVVAGLAMFPYKYGEDVAQYIQDLQAGKTVPDQTDVPGVVVRCEELSTVFPQWYLDAGK
jgi:ABC-type sugar transport system substrate-binding protein